LRWICFCLLFILHHRRQHQEDQQLRTQFSAAEAAHEDWHLICGQLLQACQLAQATQGALLTSVNDTDGLRCTSVLLAQAAADLSQLC